MKYFSAYDELTLGFFRKTRVFPKVHFLYRPKNQGLLNSTFNKKVKLNKTTTKSMN